MLRHGLGHATGSPSVSIRVRSAVRTGHWRLSLYPYLMEFRMLDAHRPFMNVKKGFATELASDCKAARDHRFFRRAPNACC